MFPLSNCRLIRINKDGTNGEIIQSKKPTMVFGSSIMSDYHIKDVDPTKNICCEISTDKCGRVSTLKYSSNYISIQLLEKKLNKKNILFVFCCFGAKKTCTNMFSLTQ